MATLTETIAVKSCGKSCQAPKTVTRTVQAVTAVLWTAYRRLLVLQTTGCMVSGKIFRSS